jgi:hypothetical protein
MMVRLTSVVVHLFVSSAALGAQNSSFSWKSDKEVTIALNRSQSSLFTSSVDFTHLFLDTRQAEECVNTGFGVFSHIVLALTDK